jgi:hypothetical protein
LRGEQRIGVGADPRLVDVRGAVYDTTLHHARHGHSDRTVRLWEVLQHLREHLGHRIGSGGLRSQDLVTIRREVSGLQVDRRALDAAAAEVDAEGKSHGASQPPHPGVRKPRLDGEEIVS